MNICSLVNYNLDGVISEIILSQIYKINSPLKCGYAKANQYLNQGILYADKRGQPFDKLIIASMAISKSMEESLSGHYGPSLSIIDHHPQTEYLITNNNSGAKIVWDTTKSSAKLIYDIVTEIGKVDVSKYKILADAAHIYEFWKTDNDLWGMAYALNILFWHYNGFKFVDRYIDGVSKNNPLITEEEKKIVSDIITTKQHEIKSATREVFNEDSVLYFNVSSDVISDISLQSENKDMSVIYIFYTNFQNKKCLSIRKSAHRYKKSPLNLIVNDVVGKNPREMNGGGHVNTASITFENDVSLNNVIDIIEYMDKIVKGIPTPSLSISFGDENEHDENDVPF